MRFVTPVGIAHRYNGRRQMPEYEGKEPPRLPVAPCSSSSTDPDANARVSDDLPKCVQEWLSTVTDEALRQLDFNLLLDLVRIEGDPVVWHEVAQVVVSEIERRTLLDEIREAQHLTDALVRELGLSGRDAIRPSAESLIEQLKSSSNPAVRRTIDPLRVVRRTRRFPRVTSILDDANPEVPCKAIRAVEQRMDGGVDDVAPFRRLYDDAVSVAATLWDGAKVEGMPDADLARCTVESLAQALAQNRTALLALTALTHSDSYTFTHMVNVSILTMEQARCLGIEGPLLRQFGVSALLHDIGKVKTPTEILNKPGRLTAREFDVIKRHTIDGAAILRRTPEIPPLAPVVAFEHHLRNDGSGYPVGVARPSLNLGTMLCGIADVYDAMRSQRVYQQGLPTSRILEVLQCNNGSQFDQDLVRRFAALVNVCSYEHL